MCMTMATQYDIYDPYHPNELLDTYRLTPECDTTKINIQLGITLDVKQLPPSRTFKAMLCYLFLLFLSYFVSMM